MKKMINTEHIEGRVYQHTLAVKTVQNQASANFGKEFISGNLEIAIDEEGLNVIPVHFTYVTETTGAGNKNATFTNLKRIIDGGKTWITDGKDDALKVKVDTALALNDFYTRDDELVSTKVNEGGFVSIITELCNESERNTFTTDMVITNVVRVDANPERQTDEYVSVRGAIFNFRGDLLPMDFAVKHADGMKYFENLGVTPAEPVFTKIWGKINCGTISTEIKEDSAFGESSVRTYERKVREWAITGTSTVPYDFGDEKVLTSDELTKAMQNRELMLAETKKRSEEYRANQAALTSTPVASSAPTPSASAKAGAFNF